MIFVPLLQFNLVTTNGATVPAPSGLEDVYALAAPVLLALVLVLILMFLLLWLRRWVTSAKETERAFKKTVLLLRVPKESAEKEETSKREKSLQEIQEDIAVMENVFASLGGLKADRSWRAWWFGREDAVSFEMVAKDGLVSFYIVAPQKLTDFLIQQIQAQFPHAQLELEEDYNIFQATGTVRATELLFERQIFFPIKTFRKSEVDPLNSLTNALSKIDKTDGAGIQIIVRSAPKEWRSPAVKVVRALQKGKSLKEALYGKSAFKLVQDALKSPEKLDQTKADHRLTPLEEEMVKAIDEKASKFGLDVTVRIVVAAERPAQAEIYLQNLYGAFAQYASPQYGNSFKPSKLKSDLVADDFVFRRFGRSRHMVMTPEELASLFHPPLPSTETPNIRWLTSRKPPPPPNLPKSGLFLGDIKYRGIDHKVFLKDNDRLRHMYIIGKSGTGKSEFLKRLIQQDIQNGKGVCVIDPHGEFAEDCLTFVPKSRAEDVIYFDPSDIERPLGLNLIEYDPRYPEQKSFVVNELINIFDKLYDLRATGGPMFEYYMRNALLLVMDDPESGATLMEIPKVLADEQFRKFKLSRCKTQVVKDFWIKEAQKAGGEASLANLVPYISSKLNPFITNDIVRPIISQPKSAFNAREVMDQSKILILNLAKGKLGESNSYLIGLVLVSKILMAAFSRTDTRERPPFFLYIDEFQNFITDSINSILSEARKYGLGLVVAHQYIGQLVKNNDTKMRDAIFGNAGSMIAYRVSNEDGEIMAKEFAPTFTPYDLINTEAFTVNAKILIDNSPSKPFNMSVLGLAKGSLELVEAIKQLSRLKYGRARAVVEAELYERWKMAEVKEVESKKPFDFSFDDLDEEEKKDEPNGSGDSDLDQAIKIKGKT